jgi:hypothetical protein
MIPRPELVAAFRTFLDRAVGQEATADLLQSLSGPVLDLCLKFLASANIPSAPAAAEAQPVPRALKPLAWGRSRVEVHVGSDQLAKMTRALEMSWERMGRNEPYWSVLTQDRHRIATRGPISIPAAGAWNRVAAQTSMNRPIEWIG